MYLTCAACRQRCLMTSSFWSRGLTTASGFLGVDDREYRHVAVAQQEADLLVRDLAERAKPLHSLRADLDLQHVGQAHAREDLLPRKRRAKQHVDDAFGLAQEAGPQQIEARRFRRGKQARRLAFGPRRRGVGRVVARTRLAPSVPALHHAVGNGDHESADCYRKQDSGGHGRIKSKAFSKARAMQFTGADLERIRSMPRPGSPSSQVEWRACTPREVRTLRVALLLLASGGCVSSAHAADVPFSLGGLYGYGNRTNVYGVQAVWAPQEGNEFLAPHDLGLRLTAQVARWVASESDAQYHSLTDGSVMAELRYWLSSEAPVRPFAEAGLRAASPVECAHCGATAWGGLQFRHSGRRGRGLRR